MGKAQSYQEKMRNRMQKLVKDGGHGNHATPQSDLLVIPESSGISFKPEAGQLPLVLPEGTQINAGATEIENTGTTTLEVGNASEAKSEIPLALDMNALLFGNTSEVCMDLTSSTKPFAMALYKDGLWEKRDTKLGSFIFHKAKFDVPYANKTCEPSFTLKMPKIPVGVLNATVDFFKLIMAKLKNSEAMVQIFWNDETKKYFIYVPDQKVSGASIRFEHNKDFQNDPKYYWCLDIHSHNTMGAFFSGGDDADEKASRLFGVIGQLKSTPYAHKWRAGVNGKYYPLEKEDIWDMEATDVYSIPLEAMDKVTELTYQSYGSNHGGSVYTGGYTPHWSGGRSPRGNVQVTDYTSGNKKMSWSDWMKQKNNKRSTDNVKSVGQKTHIRHHEPRYEVTEEDSGQLASFSGFARGFVPHGMQEGDNDNITPFPDFTLEMTADYEQIQMDGVRALREVIRDLKGKIVDGPSILTEAGLKEPRKQYENASEILFELLEIVLFRLNEEISADLQHCDYEASLTDICVYMGMILKKFLNPERHLKFIADEATGRIDREIAARKEREQKEKEGNNGKE